MKIIVVGLGDTGILASSLMADEHDVTVVDSNSEIVDRCTDKYNVSGVVGSGASRNILIQAGAEKADIIVALTPFDEINLLICKVAKNCGTRYSIAMVHLPELARDRDYFKKEFDIDYVVNPKQDTAAEIARQIGLPGNVRADAFFNSDATIIKIKIDGKSPLVGKDMRDVKSFFATEMLVVSVVRGKKAYIPDGRFILEDGDVIGVIAPDWAIKDILDRLGLIRERINNVWIIGGGTTAYYLATRLLGKKKNVKIFDNNRERCISLSEQLPEAGISYVDSVDSDVLIEEGIKKADACVTLTGSDETNLVISLFAWSCGVESVITRVRKPSYEKLLNRENLDITISPAVICAERIMGFVRNVTVFNKDGNDIDCLYQILGGLTEAIEFTAYDNFAGKDIPFSDKRFCLRKDIIIAAIIRNKRVFIPDGQTSIKTGDKVIVAALKGHGLNVLNDILK